MKSEVYRPNVFFSLSPDCPKRGTIFFDFADSLQRLANKCPVTSLLALVSNRSVSRAILSNMARRFPTAVAAIPRRRS